MEQPGPKCGKCGYDLRGAPVDRCPECGSRFLDAGIITPAAARRRTRARRLVLLFSVAVILLGAALAIALYQTHTAKQTAEKQRKVAETITGFLQDTLDEVQREP